MLKLQKIQLSMHFDQAIQKLLAEGILESKKDNTSWNYVFTKKGLKILHKHVEE